MEELTLYENSTQKIISMATKVKDTLRSIAALEATKNKTAMIFLAKQNRSYNYQIAYILGMLKANIDILPDEISEQQIEGIPLNFLIKMVVDKNVLDIRENGKPDELTVNTRYEDKYLRLSEIVCGVGYGLVFNEEYFERFFPNGMHMFVLGFAEGYSETLHGIAKQAKVEMDLTDPKKQDIWKNYPFFLNRDCDEYRLDGKYIDLSCHPKFKELNKNVYNVIKNSNQNIKKIKWDVTF